MTNYNYYNVQKIPKISISPAVLDAPVQTKSVGFAAKIETVACH
jgi:hypothetical protein